MWWWFPPQNIGCVVMLRSSTQKFTNNAVASICCSASGASSLSPASSLAWLSSLVSSFCHLMLELQCKWASDAVSEDSKQYSCYKRRWNNSKSKVAKTKDQHKTFDSKNVTSFKRKEMCALKRMFTKGVVKFLWDSESAKRMPSKVFLTAVQKFRKNESLSFLVYPFFWPLTDANGGNLLEP